MVVRFGQARKPPLGARIGPTWFHVLTFMLLFLGTRSEIKATQEGSSPPKLGDVLGKRIGRVEISTGTNIDVLTRDALQSIIGIRSGDSLQLPQVREAVVRLHESGRASQVTVEATLGSDVVNLRFVITPQARIRSVEYSGVEEDIQGALRRRLGELDPGSRLSTAVLGRAAEEIVEYLHTLGFFQTDVAPSFRLDETLTQADVTFSVVRGPRSSVSAVDLSGNTRLPLAELLDVMATRPGLPYEKARLQSDIDRLRELYLRRGYLAPGIGVPIVTNDPDANAVRVEVPIEAGPRVTVSIEGFDVSSRRLREILPIYREGGLDPATLEEGRLNLLEEVQRAGYFFAEIRVKQERVSDNQSVRVIYDVDSGRKYKLAEIRIQGTDQVAVADLGSRLGSTVGGRFSRGVTSRDLMRQDELAIVAYLRNRGYRRAIVRETRQAVKLRGEDLIIIYVVEPGPQSRIARIVFEGRKELSAEELLAASTLRVDQPFSDLRLNEAAGRIERIYSEQGFAESEITPQVSETSPEDVTVVFRIKEGPRIRVRRIVIRGNRQTTEASVRKFLTFREGELLVKEEFEESTQNLLNTGSFQRVTITKEEPGAWSAPSDERNVLVDLIESQRYQIAYGAGYRTDDGPRGLFEISDSNLLGRLYAGGVRLRASRREQIGQVSITNPRPFGWSLPTLFSGFYQRQQEVGFNASRLTGVIQVERRLDPISQFIFRYSFSDVLITNVTDPQSLRRQDETVQIGRAAASYVRDERNAVFDATAGNYTSIDVSLASVGLFGDVNFVRLFTEHQRFYRLKLLPSAVFAFDARLGLAQPFGRTTEIPISERFFAGGSTTLRGFGFDQAGPRAPDTEKSGQTKPAGGNAVILLNGEVRFPIWDRLRLGGAFFYDTGNVFERISDISLSRFTHTIGFGLRLRTPVGPIRVDFGYLLRREPLVPRSRTHFTFGPPF